MSQHQDSQGLAQQFASDNYSGIVPEAWAAMQQANEGHAWAYGEDPWTQQAADLFRETFHSECEVFFVFNGTAANSLALASLCSSYHSVICQETAHIETDECGAPEFFSNGAKLLLGQGELGKLTPDSIQALVEKRQDIHYPKPKVVSITQATELGTLYSPKELKAIGETCRRLDLRLHMDGARFANALAALDCDPGELTHRVGVDVLTLGGTKNGMAVGEAVIFFNRHLAEDFDRRCKQAGQLASKMRFISAPWLGLLRDDAWLRHAAHANAMAAYLEQRLLELPGVDIMFPRQANAVFASIPQAAQERLRGQGWRFYSFIGVGGARFMCSWDTRPERIDELIEHLAQALKG